MGSWGLAAALAATAHAGCASRSDDLRRAAGEAQARRDWDAARAAYKELRTLACEGATPEPECRTAVRELARVEASSGHPAAALAAFESLEPSGAPETREELERALAERSAALERNPMRIPMTLRFRNTIGNCAAQSVELNIDRRLVWSARARGVIPGVDWTPMYSGGLPPGEHLFELSADFACDVSKPSPQAHVAVARFARDIDGSVKALGFEAYVTESTFLAMGHLSIRVDAQ